MGLFSPVKRHPNAFRYIPRYYDPEKERREQRRRELHGTCAEQDGVEYTPGQYIRTQREARRLAQSHRSTRQMPSSIFLVVLVLLVLAIFVLYPRIVAVFDKVQSQQNTQQQQEVEEFNPYTPITIVPNDYKE